MVRVRAITSDLLDVRTFFVDAETHEEAQEKLVDRLKRGEWPEDEEGWLNSPVHIVRVKAG